VDLTAARCADDWANAALGAPRGDGEFASCRHQPIVRVYLGFLGCGVVALRLTSGVPKRAREGESLKYLGRAGVRFRWSGDRRGSVETSFVAENGSDDDCAAPELAVTLFAGESTANIEIRASFLLALDERRRRRLCRAATRLVTINTKAPTSA
jgi:hypothetical protein